MRINCSFDISTVFTVSDSGYTRNMTLPEIEKWAKDHMGSITVLLKEGGGEPKPVRAKMRLAGVTFIPDEEKS